MPVEGVPSTDLKLSCESVPVIHLYSFGESDAHCEYDSRYLSAARESQRIFRKRDRFEQPRQRR